MCCFFLSPVPLRAFTDTSNHYRLLILSYLKFPSIANTHRASLQTLATLVPFKPSTGILNQIHYLKISFPLERRIVAPRRVEQTRLKLPFRQKPAPSLLWILRRRQRFSSRSPQMSHIYTLTEASIGTQHEYSHATWLIGALNVVCMLWVLPYSGYAVIFPPYENEWQNFGALVQSSPACFS